MKNILKQLQLFYGDIVRDLKFENGEIVLEISDRTIKVARGFRCYRVTLNGEHAKCLNTPSEVVDLVEEYIDMKIEEPKPMRKVTKATVKSIIRKEGSVTVALVPYKANCNSLWVSPMIFTFHSVEEFETGVAHYIYYNCNAYSGTYPHYYI